MATAADPPPIRRVGDWRITRAPAKINLGLRIVGRRADGYHLLDSLVAFAAFSDHVALRPTASAPRLVVLGPFAAALAGEPTAGNLALLAAAAFRDAFGGPASDIVLWKRLPVASGIGGGSADAAATLRLIAAAVGYDPAAADLARLALALGADVPMCLAGQTARVGGVGEVIGPAPVLPPLPAVLLNPGVPVATPAVFRARDGDFSRAAALDAAYRDVSGAAGALARFGNDLTRPASAVAPEIAEALAALRASDGVVHAGMSGSGATCYGLYPERRDAALAAAALGRARRDWWVRSTVLNG